MASVFVFLYALLCLYDAYCSQTCPKSCICEQESSLQCFRVHSVPQDIRNDLRKIYLGHLQLKDIKVQDFSDLPSLEEVTLSSGIVEKIDTNVFRHHVSLRTLDLQNNKLKQLPYGLPPGLEIILLGNNRIRRLQQLAFDGLVKLQILNLQSNQISALRANVLSSLGRLEKLHLEKNKIESIHCSLRLPLLNLLSMANNRISSMPSSFFSSLQSLNILDLSSNLLSKVPRSLPKSLIHLNLDHNQIRSLRNRDMSHLHNLTTLSVSFNRLVSVDGGLRLPSLCVCELAGNYLRRLPGRLSSKLEKLDCRQNKIQEVTFQQLAGMTRLKHLFLENNTIHNFEANALRNCFQLSNLALEQNLLTAIPLGLPETLVRLDLKGNNIGTIHEAELRPLRRLQVLNLHNNRLSILPSLRLLTKLKLLYLDGNPWQCSCDLLKVKKALVEHGVEIRPDICSKLVFASLDEWRAFVLTQNVCEDDTKHSLMKTQVLNNHDNDDYDW